MKVRLKERVHTYLPMSVTSNRTVTVSQGESSELMNTTETELGIYKNGCSAAKK
jgi:hypothetical protein